MDRLRDELWQHHPQIRIKDISFYNVEVFNQCENNNALLMAVPIWQSVHPLLKIIPVDWDYSMPFGLMHAPEPSPTVQSFLDAVSRMFPDT